MILDLPPAVEQLIIYHANQRGISPERYIMSLLPNRPASFNNVRGILANRLDDALAYQHSLREEWDDVSH